MFVLYLSYELGNINLTALKEEMKEPDQKKNSAATVSDTDFGVIPGNITLYTQGLSQKQIDQYEQTAEMDTMNIHLIPTEEKNEL